MPEAKKKEKAKPKPKPVVKKVFKIRDGLPRQGEVFNFLDSVRGGSGDTVVLGTPMGQATIQTIPKKRVIMGEWSQVNGYVWEKDD